MCGTSYSNVDMIATIDTNITVHAVTSVSTGNDQTGVRKDRLDLYIFGDYVILSYNRSAVYNVNDYGIS